MNYKHLYRRHKMDGYDLYSLGKEEKADIQMFIFLGLLVLGAFFLKEVGELLVQFMDVYADL